MLNPRAAAAAPCRVKGQCPAVCKDIAPAGPGRVLHGAERGQARTARHTAPPRVRVGDAPPAVSVQGYRRDVAQKARNPPDDITATPVYVPGIPRRGSHKQRRRARPATGSGVPQDKRPDQRRPGLDEQAVCVHDMRAHVETAGQIPGRRGFKDDVGDVTSCDMCICVFDGFESCLMRLF